MKWFRYYHEALDDPKVQSLRPAMFKHWVNILCIANQNKPRGFLPSVHDISFRLHLRPCQTEDILKRLVYAGLLDGDNLDELRPHGWDERQRKSDDNAPRQDKHRKGSVNFSSTSRQITNDMSTQTRQEDDAIHAQNGSNVTLLSRDCHVLDTDTEKETPLTPLRGEAPDGADGRFSYPKEFEQFWRAYPKKVGKMAALRAFKKIPGRPKVADLVAAVERAARTDQWMKENRRYVPNPATWLNEGRWDDEVDAPAKGEQKVWRNTPEDIANEFHATFTVMMERGNTREMLRSLGKLLGLGVPLTPQEQAILAEYEPKYPNEFAVYRANGSRPSQ